MSDGFHKTPGETKNSFSEPKNSSRELAREYGLEFIDVLPAGCLDTDLISNLAVEWARSHCLLPVRIDGDACVLTADPTAVEDQNYLELMVGGRLRPVVAERTLIMQGIERAYYSRDRSPGDYIRDLEPEEEEISIGRVKADDLLQAAESAPATQLVKLIILEAVKQGASDVHFEAFESRLRVRYRIDGVLYEKASPPKHLEQAIVSRVKVMAGMDIAEKRLPQDGMARVRVGEREIDLRVSTVPVAEGERVVLRLLDRDATLLPLSKLGMDEQMLRLFRDIIHLPHGIIPVCGPTGSGKTTTLYAALNEIDSTRKNILTIEEPIEYQLPDIGQMQVKPKIGLTFANGLRHILRQDPDVILVGETRDLETAEISIRSSLTGHMVFTTLHTNDACGAVVRLLDMGVEPYLLASCLRGALAQRLVRTLCANCRRPVEVSEEDIAELGPAGGKLAGKRIWTSVGCDQCLEGFRGRSGLFELMHFSGEMADVLRAGNVSPSQLRTMARKDGMKNFEDAGVDSVLEGVTSLEEVIRVTRT